MFKGRRGLLFLLAGLSAFGPMSLDFYLPAFESVAVDFGVEVGSVQLTMATYLVGMGAGQILWGPTADRYGRKRPLTIGLVLYMVSSLLIAVAPTFSALVGLRLLQGIAGAAGIVLGRAIVRDLFSGSDLARAMSAVVSVFAVTPVIAPVLGSVILLVAPWRAMFVFLAVFGGACLVGVLRLPESLPPERRTTHGFFGAMRQYGAIATNGRFVYTVSIAALGGATIQAFISSSSIVFMEEFGTSAFVFSLIFAGCALCFTLGAQVNMRLLRRHHAFAILRLSVAVQLVGSVLTLLAALAEPPLALYLAPLLLVNLASAGVNSNGVAISIEPFPHAAVTAAALVGATQMAASATMAAMLSAFTLVPTVEMPIGMVLAGATSLTVIALGHRRFALH